MYLSDTHPRARAINAFIDDIINKDCVSVAEAKNHILNLTYFCRAHKSTFAGLLYDTHEEWIQMVKLCHVAIEDLVDFIKSVEQL